MCSMDTTINSPQLQEDITFRKLGVIQELMGKNGGKILVRLALQMMINVSYTSSFSLSQDGKNKS